MKISVIIPTYNRKDILVNCIRALENQSISKDQYEILIIDDGATDGTEEFVAPVLKQVTVSSTYFKQPNKGPAAARNYGIKQAKGEILIIIGDDILVTPNFIEQHLKSHNEHPEENIAILGFTTWSEDIKVTPLMYWLEHGGPQFSYDQIKEKIDITQDIVYYFYTSNISLKKSFILKNGFFDEDFPYAAFEDTEFAFRLRKLGLRLLYNKNAIAYHHHPMTMESVSRRMQKVGESMPILFAKQPDLIPVMRDIFPKPTWKTQCKGIIFQVLSYPEQLMNNKSFLYRYYSILMMQQLWVGYNRVQKKQ